MEAQRPLAFDEMGMEGRLGYEHYYHQNIADNPQAGTPKAKMKRLGLELRKLAEEGSLPVSAESAIYVMRDEARVDVLKVGLPPPPALPVSTPPPTAAAAAAAAAAAGAWPGRGRSSSQYKALGPIWAHI